MHEDKEGFKTWPSCFLTFLKWQVFSHLTIVLDAAQHIVQCGVGASALGGEGNILFV